MKTKSDSSDSTIDKQGKLNGALSQIKAEFGDGAVMLLDSSEFVKVETLSTGSIAVDIALGVGGLPRGRIVEVFGSESAGKTTLCLSIIAETQRNGGVAAVIDVEHSLQKDWAKTCGVDASRLLISQPDAGEDALTIAEDLIRSEAVDLIVVDSIAALVPKAELEGAMGDSAVGALGRLLSQAMRRLVGAIAKSNCVLLLTNQLRERIGVTWGSNEYQPGGRAVKFFASIRLDLRRKDVIKTAEGVAIGHRTKLKVVKNKVAAPFTECEFDVMFDEGISNFGSLVDLGLEEKLLEKKGAWIARDGSLLGQGREAAKQHLRENPALAAELAEAIKAKRLFRPTEETAGEHAA